MAVNEESREERFERQRKQLQEAVTRHRQKMETDPEYRAETEEKRLETWNQLYPEMQMTTDEFLAR